MNILYCGDENVCGGIYLSALSVRRNTRGRLDFYMLTASLKDEHRAIPAEFAEKLSSALYTVGREINVHLLDITDKFLSCMPFSNMDTRFTPLCMLRLFADVLPQIPDRILYLDADVLARGDFEDLYNTDMSDAEIAGVPDRYGKWFFGNILKHDYLNSGVLLMNTAQIRKSGLFEKCRIMCRDKKMFMPDQTALNKLAVKKKFPRRFNEQGRIRENTVFKHFTTYFKFLPYFRAVTIKPWNITEMHEKLKIFEFDDILNDYLRSNENE